jgi:hypothetical protein
LADAYATRSKVPKYLLDELTSRSLQALWHWFKSLAAPRTTRMVGARLHLDVCISRYVMTEVAGETFYTTIPDGPLSHLRYGSVEGSIADRMFRSQASSTLNNMLCLSCT